MENSYKVPRALEYKLRYIWILWIFLIVLGKPLFPYWCRDQSNGDGSCAYNPTVAGENSFLQN